MKCLFCGLPVYKINDIYNWFSMHSPIFSIKPFYCRVAILRNEKYPSNIREVHISCHHKNKEYVYFPLSRRSDIVKVEAFHSLGNFINKGFKI